MQLTLDKPPNYMPSRLSREAFPVRAELPVLTTRHTTTSSDPSAWASVAPLSLGKTPKAAAGEQSRSQAECGPQKPSLNLDMKHFIRG